MQLVYLSDEAFPRLRDGGRLLWLGPFGAATNYHDPDSDGERFATGPEEDDPGEWILDESSWAPRLPAGVYILSVLDLL